jgi:ATP synthase protein I
MNDEPATQPSPRRDRYAEQVGAKAARKAKARRDADRGVWFGLGMMGLIGRSVAIPTLLGAALGAWLDGTRQGSHSWTLALLVAGLVLGCGNAWHWVTRQDRAMHDERQDDDE